MPTYQDIERRQYAADELSEHSNGRVAPLVVDRLTVGLTRLRDLLMVRVHDDVERRFRMESMSSASLNVKNKQYLYAKTEIDIYTAILVIDEVTQGGYVDVPEDWFANWIFRLRLGEDQSACKRRVDFYRSRTIEERRLKFVSVLQKAIPESVKAPLVLFRMFPRAVRIITAVAFEDPLRAQELRAEQCRLLPAIGDCPECHGGVLDNEDVCVCCSNPVWNFSWLMAD